MRRRVTVVGSVCVRGGVSVKSHLTSGAPVRPENTATYSAGNRGQNICGVFSETTPLQRSSTAPLKARCIVGHFPAECACALQSIPRKAIISSRFMSCHWSYLQARSVA